MQVSLYDRNLLKHHNMQGRLLWWLSDDSSKTRARPDQENSKTSWNIQLEVALQKVARMFTWSAHFNHGTWNPYPLHDSDRITSDQWRLRRIQVVTREGYILSEPRPDPETAHSHVCDRWLTPGSRKIPNTYFSSCSKGIWVFCWYTGVLVACMPMQPIVPPLPVLKQKTTMIIILTARCSLYRDLCLLRMTGSWRLSGSNFVFIP